MAHFIDRRLNPKDKSLGNRRRFVKRIRKYVTRAVDESIRSRGIVDVDSGEKISIPAGGIREPTFHRSVDVGRHERVLTGNRDYRVGDRVTS